MNTNEPKSKVWGSKSLTVNCEGTKDGMLTFYEKGDGFYDFVNYFKPIVTCVNRK